MQAHTKRVIFFVKDPISHRVHREHREIKVVFSVLSVDSVRDKKSYVKKHSFADLSTRMHCPGTHSIAFIVNGAELGVPDCELES